MLSALTAVTFLLATFFTAHLVRAFDAAQGKGSDYIKEKIVDYLKAKKIRTSEQKLKTIADRVYEESQDYDVDYRLILAVMKVESNFRSDAVSKKGARGLLQIKPSLARHLSKDTGIPVKESRALNEPDKNIKIGVNHISGLLEKFENLKTALHAYNVGADRVMRTLSLNRSPDTPFTRSVLREYYQMQLVLPEPEDE